MKRYITYDDLVETYVKISTRGWKFLSSKFTFNSRERTRTAFDDDELEVAHWWIIPEVRQRWNELITGDPMLRYEDYFVRHHLAGRRGLRCLAIGSGVCSHEMRLATYQDTFAEVRCVDLAASLLKQAEREATAQGLDNMRFEVADIYEREFERGAWDVIFFHASLHHFEDIDGLVAQQLKPLLRAGGLIVINEFVGPNRLQYSNELLRAANAALLTLPDHYRQRFKSRLVKRRITGSGLWRMIVADPSECVDSAAILPALRQHMRVVEERPYGGNLLMPVLKDISHHFVGDGAGEEVGELLRGLFDLEDQYLADRESHMTFGVYARD